VCLALTNLQNTLAIDMHLSAHASRVTPPVVNYTSAAHVLMQSIVGKIVRHNIGTNINTCVANKHAILFLLAFLDDRSLLRHP
jgi:hypothetical protein